MTMWMKHMLVLGLPRVGKTTLCVNDIFMKLPKTHKAVFINIQWEDYFGKIPVTFEDPPVPLEGHKTVWNIEDHSRIIPWLSKLYENQRRSQVLHPVTVIIDECHLIFPRYLNIHNPENLPIKRLMTMGLKWNLRLILISQKPQFVSPDIYKLCERKILFKLDSPDVKHLQKLGYPANPPNVPYKFQVIE